MLITANIIIITKVRKKRAGKDTDEVLPATTALLTLQSDDDELTHSLFPFSCLFLLLKSTIFNFCSKQTSAFFFFFFSFLKNNIILIRMAIEVEI